MIQYYIILTFFCYSLPSPLSMKISGVFRKFIRQTIINLVKECRNRLIALIFNGDFSFFSERHWKIGIKTSRGINSYRKRIHAIRGEPFLAVPRSLAARPPIPFSPLRFSQLILLLCPFFNIDKWFKSNIETPYPQRGCCILRQPLIFFPYTARQASILLTAPSFPEI